MQQPHNDNSRVPITSRPCPICAGPMLLVTIEPADKKGYDQRTLECPKCAYGETSIGKID